MSARCEKSLASIAVAACLWPALAWAQAPDRAIEFEDLGLDHWLDASVRGSALSAFAATANDATALAYNPAGLARAKRFSAVASFSGARFTFDDAYDGDNRSADVDEYALQFLGAAFPLPVLRGSLVPAIGVQRLFTSSLDLSYQGFNTPDARNDRFAMYQSGATYAYHVGAAIDLSSAFSAGASLVVLDGHVDRVRQYDTQGLVVDPNVHTYVYEDMTADVDGYAARFGIQIFALDRMQLAVTVTTRSAVELEMSTLTEETRQVDNGVGTFTRATTETVTDYRVPYRIEGALAIPATPSLLITAQAGYADWAEATINSQRLITSELESVLRDVIDVRAGIEWTSSHWPLRLRAGFARSRRPSGFLEADRIDNDRLERIESESPTARYSAGAGWLWKGSIAIEAAIAHERGERTSSTIVERREMTSVSIGCGYWF